MTHPADDHLIILDAAELAAGADRLLRYHLARDPTPDTRRRAAALLRLAATRAQNAARRLELDHTTHPSQEGTP